MQGTSDDDSPVPGYLYKEICDISFKSPAHCENLLEFLVKRIGKDSCHIKLKTLKVMKYIVENGDPAFRKGLLKMSTAIRAATKYSGSPDPLHGNVPYLVVRKAAKELCQLLFDVEQEAAEKQDPLHTHIPAERIVGIGPSGSTGKYEGFGNTPVSSHKSLGSAIRDGLEKLAEQLSETPADRQRAVLSRLENSSGDYIPPVTATDFPAAGTAASTENDTSLHQPPVKKVIPKHIPGRAGGGWDDLDPEPEGEGSAQRSEGSSDLSDRLESAQAADWTAEEQLVNESLALNDRTRLLLTLTEVRQFKKKCAGLNCEKVVDFLENKLHSTSQNVVLRSLLLVETFLFADTVSPDYLAAVLSDRLVAALEVSNSQQVKDKARKIIRILERTSSHNSILPLSSVDVEMMGLSFKDSAIAAH